MPENQKRSRIDEKILNRLRDLPSSKKAEVLDFVECRSAKSQREKGVPFIYPYASTLVKEKRLKKMSLREIEALVHEVRGVKG